MLEGYFDFIPPDSVQRGREQDILDFIIDAAMLIEE